MKFPAEDSLETESKEWSVLTFRLQSRRIARGDSATAPSFKLDEEPAGIGDRLAQLRVQVLAPDQLFQFGFYRRMFKNTNTTEGWEEVQRESERESK